MSQPIIQIEDLGKRYRIGAVRSVGTLAHLNENFREMVGRRVRQIVRRKRDPRTEFWALRQLNLGIESGDVVGVIGQNGSGKSTLLKVLSRITDPTEGRVRLRGKLASLLEVGTGFHPELTGRENIYLNGTIMGMRKSRIDECFDAIVDFSGVGRFLDTPVKRYSSGMYTRLAFSVAAHLDAQVLVVDEVLAVGDAAFQRRCLEKMRLVAAEEGRTVLFVSHNMDSILQLCTKVMVLDRGRSTGLQAPAEAVGQYLSNRDGDTATKLIDRPRPPHKQQPPVFADIRVIGIPDRPGVIASNGPATVELDLVNLRRVQDAHVTISFRNDRGQHAMVFQSLPNTGLTISDCEATTIRCEIPHLALLPGAYSVDVRAEAGLDELDRIDCAARVDVMFRDIFGTGRLPDSRFTSVVMPANWTLCEPALAAAA